MRLKELSIEELLFEYEITSGKLVVAINDNTPRLEKKWEKETEKYRNEIKRRLESV